MRLAAGAAVGGTAYYAGKRRAAPGPTDQDVLDAYDATVGPPASASVRKASKLDSLVELHDAGALSDDEFSAARARMLGG